MAPNSQHPRHRRDTGSDSPMSSKRSKLDDNFGGYLVAQAESGGDASSAVTKLSPPRSIVNSHKCNVCGKGFPSHQALGGHKTSHRNKASAAAATEIPPRSGRLHQCGLCVMSYATGQALGGHMRKHYNARRRKNVENSTDAGSVLTSFADTSSGASTSRLTKFDLNLLPEPDSPGPDLTLKL